METGSSETMYSQVKNNVSGASGKVCTILKNRGLSNKLICGTLHLQLKNGSVNRSPSIVVIGIPKMTWVEEIEVKIQR